MPAHQDGPESRGAPRPAADLALGPAGRPERPGVPGGQFRRQALRGETAPGPDRGDLRERETARGGAGRRRGGRLFPGRALSHHRGPASDPGAAALDLRDGGAEAGGTGPRPRRAAGSQRTARAAGRGEDGRTAAGGRGAQKGRGVAEPGQADAAERDQRHRREHRAALPGPSGGVGQRDRAAELCVRPGGGPGRQALLRGVPPPRSAVRAVRSGLPPAGVSPDRAGGHLRAHPRRRGRAGFSGRGRRLPDPGRAGGGRAVRPPLPGSDRADALRGEPDPDRGGTAARRPDEIGVHLRRLPRAADPADLDQQRRRPDAQEAGRRDHRQPGKFPDHGAAEHRPPEQADRRHPQRREDRVRKDEVELWRSGGRRRSPGTSSTR